MKNKRRLAIAGVILILLLYVCSILFALSGSPLAQNLLSASLFCTLVVPAVIYGYQIIVKYIKNRE